jgi:hypothetical protein
MNRRVSRPGMRGEEQKLSETINSSFNNSVLQPIEEEEDEDEFIRQITKKALHKRNVS